MTKASLQNYTKDELIKTAKKKFGLELKQSEKKEKLVDAVIKAHSKSGGTTIRATGASKKGVAKKAVSKKTLKAASTAKKKATKVSAEEAKPARKIAAKKPAKAQAAPVKPARRAKVAAPKKEAPAKRRTEPAIKSMPSVPEAVPPREIAHHSALPVQEAATETKYHVAERQERLEVNHLADRYEDDRVVLLVRDPHYVHTFWDVNQATPQKTASRFGIDMGGMHVALRIYDVTDVIFNGTNANRSFDIAVNTLKGSWYINVPQDDRYYCIDVGLRDAAGNFYTMARSNVAGVPRAGVSSRVDEEWMVVDEDFWRMYALSGGFSVGKTASSAEIFGMMQKRLAGEVSSGAVSSFGASGMPFKKKDEFWFKLDCELIVYGATKPDATVTLNGAPVKLRKDGTFTARFHLPDGVQVLPAVAVSADGQFERTITPTVSRATTAFSSDKYVEEEEGVA